MDVSENNDNRSFSHAINKRPNKGLSRYRNIQPNKTTGISKSDDKSKPANQLKNPLWDHKSNRWIEDPYPNRPDVGKDEGNQPPTFTSETFGRVGDPHLLSRTVSNSRITPWRKYTIGRGVHSRQYSRQPSRLPLGSGQGGRRSTHKHKRKNKHTRRRRVQRRRA